RRAAITLGRSGQLVHGSIEDGREHDAAPLQPSTVQRVRAVAPLTLPERRSRRPASGHVRRCRRTLPTLTDCPLWAEEYTIYRIFPRGARRSFTTGYPNRKS